jgi:hypothetical protein
MWLHQGKTFVARFEPWRVSLHGLLDRWFTGTPQPPYLMSAVLGLAWLGLLVSSFRARRLDGARGFFLRTELLLLVSLLLYFYLPQTTYKPMSWWYISGRMPCFIAILAALTPRGPILEHGSWRRWLLVPVAVVGIAYPLVLTVKWRRFDHRAAGFARLMRLVPRGSNTIVLPLGGGQDPDVDPGSVPYLEFHSLAQVLAGGFDPWSQETPLGGFPMSPREDRALPAPKFNRPSAFSMETHGMHYDYVLTRNEWADYGFIPNDGRARLVGADSGFRLYKVQEP